MEILGVPLRQATATYAHIRPERLLDAARLCFGYSLAAVAALLRPSTFQSVGHLIPGQSNLTVQVSGIRAYVRPGTADLGLLAASLEPKAAEWFQVKGGEVVVDVGAHIGRYSLVAARLASRVVAIEPEPSNFEMLEANIKLNGFTRVTALRLALGNTAGRGLLYLPGKGDTGTASLDPAWQQGAEAKARRNAVSVECETLDRVASSLGLGSVDWLKVDVEGLEVAVLEGARETLSKTGHLILEVAKDHEDACMRLTETAGLRLSDVEKARGARTCNWLLHRRN